MEEEMFLLTLKSIFNPSTKRKPPFLSRTSDIDQASDLCDETYFNNVLRLEKKRVERSGKSFLLMLINIESLGLNGAINIPAKIAFVLASSTREIDIKGWYRSGSVIGVVFTELRDLNKDFVQDRIFRKIYKGLSAVLDFDQLSQLDIVFRFFPDEEVNGCLFAGSSKSDSQSKATDIEIETQISATESDKYQGRSIPTEVKNQQEQTTHKESITYSFFGRRFFLILGDVVVIWLAGLIGALARFSATQKIFDSHFIGFALTCFIYPTTFYIFDLYNMGRSFRSRDSMLRIAVAVLMGVSLCTFLFYFIAEWNYSRAVLLLQMSLLLILTIGWRVAYARLFQASAAKIGTLVIGASECGKAIYRLLNSPFSPYEVRGFLDDDCTEFGQVCGNSAVLGPTSQLGEIARQVWARAAIIAVPRDCRPTLIREILEARLRGMEIIEMPTAYERLTGRVPVKHIEDQWLLFADGFYLLSKEYVQKIKRLTDIAVATIILAASAPVMAIIALLIRIESPGPVFYRQDRVGKGGKVFSVIKFRSMIPNAEAEGAKWASKKDPRVTRVGHWLRLLRLDEIPQVWNVFKGHMTLVGPRPERPEFVEQLAKEIPYYGIRHAVSPGITGWAQVNYPYGASVADALNKLEYDLFYIKNMSLVLDFKILLKTIGVVLLGQGAR